MKVLFICSGNSKSGISSLIKAQGESLEKCEINIAYFTIKGKGFINYGKNVFTLRKFIRSNDFDIYHAHFSLTAFVASLAGSKPLVVSLMGWNVKRKLTRFLVKCFNFFSWKACIVKSLDMKQGLGIKNIEVIPNGIDTNLFRPIDKKQAQTYLKWDLKKKHFLFAGNPERPIKNYVLAKEAFKKLNNKAAEMHYLKDIPHDEMVYHFNASDVVLLTSKDEGSPNVIKEAMACNCVIVSTDVGDVKERFDNAEGCYLCAQNADDISSKINIALKFAKKTNAREKLENLRSDIVAKKIIAIYTRVLNKNSK